MNHCETCKHWSTWKNDEPWGECMRSGQDDAPMRGEGAYDDGAALMTKAEFGCTEWEAKEP